VQCSWVCSKRPVVNGQRQAVSLLNCQNIKVLLSERVTYVSITSTPNNVAYRAFVYSPLASGSQRVTLEDQERRDCRGELTRTWAGSPHLEKPRLPLLGHSFVLRLGAQPYPPHPDQVS
jgi:hypothetical protein